jgi:hypothetical protein
LALSSSSFKPQGTEQVNDSPRSSVSNEDSQSIHDISQIADPDRSSDDNILNDDLTFQTKTNLPLDYQGPELTTRIKECINENKISRFDPHTAMRGELLSLIFADVTKSYQLL